MMDEIFKKEIEENLIIVYMDDILAFFKTIDGLKKIEQIILEKAREYDLFQSQEVRIQKTENRISWTSCQRGKIGNGPR
jgi:hypothetical protein